MSGAHALRVRAEGRERPVAVVTGAGTPNGIGAATARRLADDGCRVLAALEPGQAPPPPATAHVAVDLADPAADAAIWEAARRDLGEAPSILVASAAHSTRDGYARLSAAELDRHHAINDRATALLATRLCRELPAGQAGRIVALTTGQAGAMPGELAYAASKGAIDALCRTLAAEVAHLGITVNCVDPGATDTGWMDEPTRARLRDRFPMGRLGEPDDAARLIAFLCSDAARWITGQSITSDGGFGLLA